MSELSRFEIDENDTLERQVAGLRRLATALVTNPNLTVGDRNSDIVFPDQNPARASESTPAATPGETSGAFYGTRTVVSEDATNGDIYLQGGSVSGWATPLDEVLIFDQSAAAGVGAWTGTPGQVLQLKVTVSGSESSGIPNSGVTPTAAAITIESTLGTDTYPTGSADMTGKFCHISLGAFFDGGFSPAGAGNVNIGWCFSNAYTVSRE